MSVFRIDIVGHQIDPSLPLTLHGHMPAQEYAQFVQQLNAELEAFRELEADQQSFGCCLLAIAFGTCGIGMFLGGICAIHIKNKQFAERKASITDKIRQFLAARNAVWGEMGFNMTMRTEVSGFVGRGKHRRPVEKTFIEVQVVGQQPPPMMMVGQSSMQGMMQGMAPQPVVYGGAPPPPMPMYHTTVPVQPVDVHQAPPPVYGQAPPSFQQGVQAPQ